MLIKFICGDKNISSNDFMQGSLDFIYDDFSKTYTRRFFGLITFSKGNSIYSFLETNAFTFNLFTIEFYDLTNTLVDSFTNGKLFSTNKDIINDLCRIEIKEVQVTN